MSRQALAMALAQGAQLAAYEVICDDDQLFTSASRRLTQRHPILWRLAVLQMALHLTGDLPGRVDPVAALMGVRVTIRRLSALRSIWGGS